MAILLAESVRTLVLDIGLAPCLEGSFLSHGVLLLKLLWCLSTAMIKANDISAFDDSFSFRVDIDIFVNIMKNSWKGLYSTFYWGQF